VPEIDAYVSVTGSNRIKASSQLRLQSAAVTKSISQTLSNEVASYGDCSVLRSTTMSEIEK